MFAILPSLALALASEFIDNDNILAWVAMAGQIVSSGFETDVKLQELSVHIQQMVAEERNPTQAEWDAMAARSEAAHDAIQNWRPGQ